MDLDAALLELAAGVGAELARDVGQDRRSRVDEHPPLLHVAQRRVVAERCVREVVELGERLDAGVARADEHEPELRLRAAGRRRLEPLQDVVAKRDAVGEILEAAAVLGEARHREDPVDRTERDDEPLVGDRGRPGDRVGADGARLEVERRLRGRARGRRGGTSGAAGRRRAAARACRTPPRAGAACRASSCGPRRSWRRACRAGGRRRRRRSRRRARACRRARSSLSPMPSRDARGRLPGSASRYPLPLQMLI